MELSRLFDFKKTRGEDAKLHEANGIVSLCRELSKGVQVFYNWFYQSKDGLKASNGIQCHRYLLLIADDKAYSGNELQLHQNSLLESGAACVDLHCIAAHRVPNLIETLPKKKSNDSSYVVIIPMIFE